MERTVAYRAVCLSDAYRGGAVGCAIRSAVARALRDGRNGGATCAGRLAAPRGKAVAS